MSLPARFRRGVLELARSPAGSALVRLWLRVAPGLIPLRVLSRTRSLVVAAHPAPSYSEHLLLIPLPPLAGLQSLPEETGGLLLAEVVNTARRLALANGAGGSWQLVVNGGAYQEVGVLHFHLVSQEPGTANSARS